MRTAGPRRGGVLMVMRRVDRFEEDGPTPSTLARIRRTPRQALGQGLFAGATGGVILLVASAAAQAVRWIGGGGLVTHAMTWALLAFAAPLVVGAAVGLWAGVQVGVDADDQGLRMHPAAGHAYAPWLKIVDIRRERRRTRTVVVVYLKEGPPVRLLAPYDGGALSHDPNFERKYFTLLNLWETHRSWRNAP